MPGGNGLQGIQVRIRELVDDGLRHLPIRVVHDPLLRPRDGVGKALNDLRMRRHITLAGEIGGVGDLPGLLADGAEDIPMSGALYLRGGGLKQRHIVPLSAGEGPGHHVELHRGVHHRVLLGYDAVLLEDVFQRHLRHAALAPADDGLAPQIVPVEGLITAAHQERAVPLGQLGEDHRQIVLALRVDIDAALRPGQADVRAAGYHGGHHLVGAAAVAQLDVQPLVGEEPLAHSHVLRCVEHRVRHLAEPDRDIFRLRAGGIAGIGPRAAAGQQAERQQRGHTNADKLFFHARTPHR